MIGEKLHRLDGQCSRCGQKASHRRICGLYHLTAMKLFLSIKMIIAVDALSKLDIGTAPRRKVRADQMSDLNI